MSIERAMSDDHPHPHLKMPLGGKVRLLERGKNITAHAVRHEITTIEIENYTVAMMICIDSKAIEAWTITGTINADDKAMADTMTVVMPIAIGHVPDHLRDRTTMTTNLGGKTLDDRTTAASDATTDLTTEGSISDLKHHRLLVKACAMFQLNPKVTGMVTGVILVVVGLVEAAEVVEPINHTLEKLQIVPSSRTTALLHQSYCRAWTKMPRLPNTATSMTCPTARRRR